MQETTEVTQRVGRRMIERILEVDCVTEDSVQSDGSAEACV